jgi:hypothetical protein
VAVEQPDGGGEVVDRDVPTVAGQRRGQLGQCATALAQQLQQRLDGAVRVREGELVPDVVDEPQLLAVTFPYDALQPWSHTGSSRVSRVDDAGSDQSSLHLGCGSQC